VLPGVRRAKKCHLRGSAFPLRVYPFALSGWVLFLVIKINTWRRPVNQKTDFPPGTDADCPNAAGGVQLVLSMFDTFGYWWTKVIRALADQR
jgi:hypothetical protein